MLLYRFSVFLLQDIEMNGSCSHENMTSRPACERKALACLEGEPLVMFYIYNIFIPIVLAIGTIGNSLNLATLWRSTRMSGTAYTYMRWLAVTDSCALVFWAAIDVIRASPNLPKSMSLAWYNSHLAWFFTRAFGTCSNLLVTALTIDRYELWKSSSFRLSPLDGATFVNSLLSSLRNLVMDGFIYTA